TAGWKWAAAVPDVQSASAGRPDAFPRPRAKKAAERSSRWTWRRIRASSARARASGADREPGATTASVSPARAHSSTTVRAHAVLVTMPAPPGRPPLAPRGGPPGTVGACGARGAWQHRPGARDRRGGGGRSRPAAGAGPRLHPGAPLLGHPRRRPRAAVRDRAGHPAGPRPAGGPLGGRPAPVRGRGGSGGRRGGGGRRPGAGHLARLLPRRTPGPAGGARPARPRRGAGVAERRGVERFVDGWLAQDLFARLPRAAAGVDERRRGTVEGLASALRLLGTGAQEPVWDRLGEIDVPVLLMAGEYDSKFSALAFRLAAGIGDRA